MMMTRIHGPSIATQWLQILRDYALLFDDSDFFREISQIAPEGIVQFLGRKEKFFGRIK